MLSTRATAAEAEFSKVLSQFTEDGHDYHPEPSLLDFANTQRGNILRSFELGHSFEVGPKLNTDIVNKLASACDAAIKQARQTNAQLFQGATASAQHEFEKAAKEATSRGLVAQEDLEASLASKQKELLAKFGPKKAFDPAGKCLCTYLYMPGR